MKISVITVCLNAVETIGYTLGSFIAQDYADKELIVIDGGSTDGTAGVVQPFLDRQDIMFVSAPDRGLYDAINKGLRLFSGDAVGMLNADDQFHDASILGRIAEGLREADMLSGHLNYVHDHREGSIIRRWREPPYWLGAFQSGWMPAHPTFYVRRRVVEAVGLYNLEFRLAADYDWMLRAFEVHHFNARLIDHVMVDMMDGGLVSGVSGYTINNIESLKSRRKWLGAGAIDYALLAKPLRKIGQFDKLWPLRRNT